MMYTKTINGRQVFSSCQTIQTNLGIWISNPTAEQIAEAGWVEYIPPQVEPQPTIEPASTDILEAVKRMLASSVVELSDEDALSVAALYPTWASKVGKPVNMGERLWYNEKLYKVVQPHTVQSDWTPDVSVSLFTEVSIAEIPDWVQPQGAHDAYMSGDKVKHSGKNWISTIDNNVYEPGVYGWEELS